MLDEIGHIMSSSLVSVCSILIRLFKFGFDEIESLMNVQFSYIHTSHVFSSLSDQLKVTQNLALNTAGWYDLISLYLVSVIGCLVWVFGRCLVSVVGLQYYLLFTSNMVLVGSFYILYLQGRSVCCELKKQSC